MSAEVLLAGIDTASSYTQQPVDQHRRKRAHDSAIADEGTRLQPDRMLPLAGDWTPNGAINVPSNIAQSQADWLTTSISDEKRKHHRRGWSLGDASSTHSKGRTPTRSYLTYLLFSVMIGINIFIIARSFSNDTHQKHHVLPQDVSQKDRVPMGRRSQAVDAKSYDLEGYYGSRDSPMLCDLCPSGDEFCKSIG
jgi:hypothetical protein